MTTNSVSLLVQSRASQRNIASLQRNMSEKGQEVTTGKKQNLVASLGGEIRNYVDLNSLHQEVTNRKERLVTADNRLAQMGVSVQEINNLVTPFQELQTLLPLVNEANIDVYIDQAAETLEGIQGAMNIQWGGRYLFSGDAVYDRPLQNIDQLTTAVDQIINDYVAALPPGQELVEADIDAMITEIDAIFDGNTFSSLVYGGSATDMAPIEIAEGQTMEYGFRADSKDFRRTFKGVAMISASQTLRGHLPNGTGSSQINNLEKRFLSQATDYTSGGLVELTHVEASLGFKQERISHRQDGLEESIFRFEQRISEYSNADQFESSVAFTQMQQQLELTFYVTSSLQQLSLLNYI